MRRLVWFLLLTGLARAHPPLFVQLAGRNVEVWKPARAGRHPLVLFSHGYKGISGQSAQLTKALAEAGCLVLAPDHRDRFSNPNKNDTAVQQPLDAPSRWTDETYRDRADDLKAVYHAALDDPELGAAIDQSRVVLMGYSLGGYIALGLAGARPAWVDPELQPCAVVCLAPYLRPLLAHRDLRRLQAPVLYEVGTRDLAITSWVVRPGGAFEQTPAPRLLVALRGAGHTAWTATERSHHASIQHYAVAFVRRYAAGGESDAKGWGAPERDVQRLRFTPRR